MDIISNAVFTTKADTRDYAIKLLMIQLKKVITSTDIPTNLVVIRHPNYSLDIWLAINKSKKVMYQINTKNGIIDKLKFLDNITKLKLDI